jgi:hypothetical protein
MIRLWITFIFFAVVIHFAISTWRTMTGKDKWALTKSIAYSIIVALLAFIVMASVVIAF